MRGEDPQQGVMFSYLSPEQRVRKHDPLRSRFKPTVASKHRAKTRSAFQNEAD